MRFYEINDILENIQYLDRNSWEQARLNVYATAQTHSKKELEITDILKFPWDKEQQHHSTEMSNEEKERLQRKAEEMQKYIKNIIN